MKLIDAIANLAEALDEAGIPNRPVVDIRFKARSDRCAFETWIKANIRFEMLASTSPYLDRGMKIYDIPVKITDDREGTERLEPQFVKFVEIIKSVNMQPKRAIMAPTWVFEKARRGEQLTDNDLKLCCQMEWRD